MTSKTKAAAGRNELPTNGKHRVGQAGRGEWSQNYRRLLKLRERLLEERTELRTSAATEIPVDQMHPAESASDEFDHSLAFSLLSAEQDALYEVEEALARIANGTYGICELTGKAIAVARLRALPWTRFTVEARKQLEAEHVFERPRIRPAQTIREPAETSAQEFEPASDEALSAEKI